MKKFICRNCGVVNEASKEALASSSDWLQCALPTGFEWILPAGKISPIVGDPIYISGFGEHLSYEEYLNKYGIDPEIAYKLMRGKNVSRIFSEQLQSAGRKVSKESKDGKESKDSKDSSDGKAGKSRSDGRNKEQSWLDEDDWTL